MLKEEGPRAFYKGLTPRLMRIMPGQAITFMTYEAIAKRVEDWPYMTVSVPAKATA